MIFDLASSENILKRDRELTGIIPTINQLLDWRIRLKELQGECDENDIRHHWLEQQIQYCDKEIEYVVNLDLNL
jgi:hypothetical protein